MRGRPAAQRRALEMMNKEVAPGLYYWYTGRSDKEQNKFESTLLEVPEAMDALTDVVSSPDHTGHVEPSAATAGDLAKWLTTSTVPIERVPTTPQQ